MILQTTIAAQPATFRQLESHVSSWKIHLKKRWIGEEGTGDIGVRVDGWVCHEPSSARESK
jgi:hypothetical protein